MKPMAITAVILGLFLVGIGGGYFYITQMRVQDAPEADEESAADAGRVSSESTEHGKSIVIPANATICDQHHVPEIVCPFCNPSLVEDLGYCGGHDVAEALCTRCNPVLIAAFKAEGDWCAEHGLPESQCLTCNPPSEG